MFNFSGFKDRLTCPGCKKEIVNKKRVMIYKCPYCNQTLFEMQWAQKEDTKKVADSLRISELIKQGNSLLTSGKLEEALKCFNDALAINAEDEGAWLNKGTVYLHMGKLDDSIKCADKALSIDPKNAMAWTNKALALNFQQKYVESIDCFDKALKLDPKYTKALGGKGVSLYCIGKTQEAITNFKKAISLGDQNTLMITKQLGITL